MNGLDGMNRWKNLKERLSLKGLGCCGATWSTRATIRTIIEEEQEEDEEQPIIFLQDHDQFPDQPPLAASAPVGNGAATTATPPRRRMMNLGMALAAERNLRGSNLGPPKAKTLMRLIEETDGVDLGKRKKRREEFGIGNVGRSENDWVCCVCMERNKGAALIPCGHAFCRICSREMWDTRGCCPICNRSILEILDIF